VRCGQCEHRKTFEDDFGNYIVCAKWKGFIADDDYCMPKAISEAYNNALDWLQQEATE